MDLKEKTILITGIKKNQYTIRVGDTRLLHWVSRLFPKVAFNFVNLPQIYKQLKQSVNR